MDKIEGKFVTTWILSDACLPWISINLIILVVLPVEVIGFSQMHINTNTFPPRMRTSFNLAWTGLSWLCSCCFKEPHWNYYCSTQEWKMQAKNSYPWRGADSLGILENQNFTSRYFSLRVHWKNRFFGWIIITHIVCSKTYMAFRSEHTGIPIIPTLKIITEAFL